MKFPQLTQDGQCVQGRCKGALHRHDTAIAISLHDSVYDALHLQLWHRTEMNEKVHS